VGHLLQQKEQRRAAATVPQALTRYTPQLHRNGAMRCVCGKGAEGGMRGAGGRGTRGMREAAGRGMRGGGLRGRGGRVLCACR